MKYCTKCYKVIPSKYGKTHDYDQLAYISQCAVIEYEARSCGCGNRA
jgi:hypothetical protein